MTDDKVKHMKPSEKLNFRVKTTTDGSKITTVIDLFDANTVMQRLMHKVVDMQEEQNIVALKSLGWIDKEEVDGLWFKIHEQEETIDAMEKALKVYEEGEQ